MSYLRPVDPTDGRMSTYYAHTRRTTPSSEAGVDYYCPIGTPIRCAGAGMVYQIGGGVVPATGRFIAVDLDDGRRVRYLHLSRWVDGLRSGMRVGRGQIIGYSGASGYGSEYFGASSLSRIPSNTGGPHVHTTLWPFHIYQFGRYPIEPTLDFELYVSGGSPAGGAGTPLGDDELDATQAKQLADIWHTLTGGITGAKDQGEIHKHVLNASAKATNADGHARAARTAAETLAADFRAGEAGVRDAGRLLLLLVDAAKPGGEAVQVDVDALAEKLAAKIGGATPDEVRSILRDTLGSVTLSLGT